MFGRTSVPYGFETRGIPEIAESIIFGKNIYDFPPHLPASRMLCRNLPGRGGKTSLFLPCLPTCPPWKRRYCSFKPMRRYDRMAYVAHGKTGAIDSHPALLRRAKSLWRVSCVCSQERFGAFVYVTSLRSLWTTCKADIDEPPENPFMVFSEPSPVSVIQASRRSTASESGSRGSMLAVCSLYFFLTLLNVFVLSINFSANRRNAFDLLKGAFPLKSNDGSMENSGISCEEARILTNTSSIVTSKGALLDEQNKTGKVSFKEARELLGGWYIPPDLYVMAREEKGIGGESGARGEEDRGQDEDDRLDPDRDVCEFCGPWMRKYAEFHRQARKVGNKGLDPKDGVKYITFTCKNGASKCISGMGDDLVGIASAFMVALATNRILLVDWDLGFGDEFEPAGVDWRVDPGMVLGWEGNPGIKTERETKRGKGKHRGWVREEVEIPENGSQWVVVNKGKGRTNGKDVRKVGSVVGNRSKSGRGVEKETKAWVIKEVNYVNYGQYRKELSVRYFQEKLGAVDHLVVRWNRGIVTKSLLGDDKETSKKLVEDLGMRPPVAFGCILRLLLRVKPEVLDEIAPVMRKLQGHSVCVHARVDDKMSGFTSNEEIKVSKNDTDALLWNAKPLFDCAEALSLFWYGGTPSFKWLVLSSSFALKEAAKKLYGDKIVTTHTHPRHIEQQSSNKETYRALVAEWALLTICDKFIITESGFSKTAVMYSLKPQSTWLFPRWENTNSTPSLCPVEYPTDVKKLGTAWSGL